MNYDKRIIGDFLEINGENIQYRENNKRNPISKIIYKYNRRKLKKAVTKLKKSNIILNRFNIIELFSYIYNNFPPDGKYDIIYRSKINMNNPDEVEGILKFDNYTVIINTCDENNISINIHITDEEGNIKNYTLNSESISTSNISAEINSILNIINKKLLDIMCNYILNVINLYD